MPAEKGSCLLLALLLSTGAGGAEVYKWVDAQGRTHYSERKADADRARAVDLQVTPQAPSVQPTGEYWQDRERQFRQRQIQSAEEQRRAPAAAPRPKSLSGGREDGSDASRCNLARDILNGALRHANGAPIDRYDREVAENDVKTYCR